MDKNLGNVQNSTYPMDKSIGKVQYPANAKVNKFENAKVNKDDIESVQNTPDRVLDFLKSIDFDVNLQCIV